ncbi:MAG TPA: hypothetical protein VFU02_09870 [Polyangiaceae bacterium]|nr:hypothetical protein [Polyangiaceae bacterium]
MKTLVGAVLTAVRSVIAFAALNGCGATLDAGSDKDAGNGLPVNAENTVILNNDGPFDNWQGEFAFLLAAQGVDLAGLVINDSGAWPDLDSNLAGWEMMRTAATASGIQGLPQPTRSSGPPLVKPASGEIAETVPNRSAGAELIVRAALEAPEPPVVVVTGGRLTDVADAYLIEPAISDRLVVVASLGELSPSGAVMDLPNGEMDPWADTIVVQRLRYVQVSAFYDQLADVPSSRLTELPENAFGDWIASKHAEILEIQVGADQVALLSVALPGFARQIERAAQAGSRALSQGEVPRLEVVEGGAVWLVTSVDGDLATQTFWELLSEVF